MCELPFSVEVDVSVDVPVLRHPVKEFIRLKMSKHAIILFIKRDILLMITPPEIIKRLPEFMVTNGE